MGLFKQIINFNAFRHVFHLKFFVHLSSKIIIMHININDKTVLKDIQKIFFNYYPFLLLKFYKTPHNKFEDSKYLDELDVDKSIGEINQLLNTIKIDIMPLERVFHFENIFFEKTGISVQVVKIGK